MHDNDPVRAIARRHDAFVAAFNRGDADWIADRFYAAEAVVIPPNAAPIAGREALRAFLRDFHGAARRSCTLTIDRCEACGDVGYVAGRYNVTVHHPGGAEMETGNLLEVWRREGDGAWRCVADMYGSDGSSADEPSLPSGAATR